MIQGSPGPEIDIMSGIELGHSYELGSGWTRIRVLTRPRWGLGMVMTVPLCTSMEKMGFPDDNRLYFTRPQNLNKCQARWQQWMSWFSYQLVYRKGVQMHVANPLSRRSDHYVSSANDNKDQVLLDPVSVKTVEVGDCTYEECQSLITDFHDTPVAGHKGVVRNGSSNELR